MKVTATEVSGISLFFNSYHLALPETEEIVNIYDAKELKFDWEEILKAEYLRYLIGDKASLRRISKGRYEAFENEHCKYVNAFLAMSEYYVNDVPLHMSTYFGVEAILFHSRPRRVLTSGRQVMFAWVGAGGKKVLTV